MNSVPASRYYSPMKQARAGLWLEAARGLAQVYKFLGIYLLFVLIKTPQHSSYLLMAALVLTLIGVVYGWLKYRSVRFYIDADKQEFVFQSGVFSHTQVVIQLRRIQQVNITRHLLQKMLHVYTVEISTAGSAETELVIRAVALQDAVALKRRLLEHSGQYETSTTETAPTTTPGKMTRLSNLTIFKTAVTSRYGKSLAIIIAFWATIYNAYRDVLRVEGDSFEDTAEVAMLNYLLDSTWGIILVLLLFLVLFNIVTGFLKYYDYRMAIRPDSIQISYGAIRSDNVIVYPAKVQAVEVISNYLQRKMNFRRLVLKQASSDFHRDQKASVEVPGCTAHQQHEILSEIFGRQPVTAVTFRPDIRKIIKPIIPFVIIPLTVYLLSGINMPYFQVVLPLWILFIMTMSFFSFRHSRMMVSDEFIVVRGGVWDISETILEPYKIQGVTVSQRLWHRSAGIAHLTLYTAANNVRFEYVRLRDIQGLIDKWLYEIERSDRPWM